MPLAKRCGKPGKNIKETKRSGCPHEQAPTAALDTDRRTCRRSKVKRNPQRRTSGRR